MTPAANTAAPGVAIFDLDGTLSRRDTLMPFLLGYVGRRPRRWWRLALAPLAFAEYLVLHRDRGRFKSRLIRIAMGGDRREAVGRWADDYVRSLCSRGAFRAQALGRLARHREAGELLILLSASPDLYVPRIGAALGFAQTICTEILWRGDRLDGALVNSNCRGAEKLHRLESLRRAFPGRRFIAYGNARSDLVHLRRADHGVLVNAGRKARRAARAQGIAVDDWH
ncbi:MAG TPA: HAD-IB family phosphatase [Steroidobacteraceae bacterium]|nr:HAD-IB family phosphatase [Steroidobacteraceae bacterium]